MNQGRFYYWGPFLYHTKISIEDVENLKKICVKDESKSAVKSLVGHFKTEYNIDTKKYLEIINKYVPNFQDNYLKFYGHTCPKLYCVRSWVNFMYAGDYNPLHIHTQCDFSSVLYLKVPNEIHDEAKKSNATGGELEGPGCVSFFYGENHINTISSKYFRPTAGDFFIFPAMLRHTVAPFKSNVERISIAANFSFKENNS